MNYGEITAKFWELIGFTDNRDGGYFSAANRLKWCNMAVIDLVAASRCLERRDTILITAGTQEYDLPTDCERINRVSHNWEKLIPTMKETLKEDEVHWDQRQGTPQFYYTDMTNDKIGLFYIPGSSTAYTSTDDQFGGLIDDVDGFGGIIDTSVGDPVPDHLFGGALYEVTANPLIVFFACRPPSISYDEDTPEVPQWAHPLVVYYMLWKALSAMTPLRDLNKASIWQDLYVHGRERLKGRMNGRLPKDWKFRTKDQTFRPRVTRMPDVIDYP